MNNIIEIIIIGYIIISSAIVILQFLSYSFNIKSYVKEKEKLLEENSRLVKAVISKNANEYVMTTSIDKVPTEEKPQADPDLVPEETLSDDEFMNSIGKSLKGK